MKIKLIFVVFIWFFTVYSTVYSMKHSMNNLESRKAERANILLVDRVPSLKEITIKYLAKNKNLLNGKAYKLTKELQQVFGYDYELYNAIFERDVAKVFELLRSGVSPNLILPHDRRKFAPIHIVALMGCIDILNCLLRFGVDINLQDSQGNTALLLAQSNRQDRIIEVLLKAGAQA